MTHMRIWILAAVALLSSAASADYVEVRQAAKIKAAPAGAADEIVTPPIGTLLDLFEPGQSNGYYHIVIPSSLGVAQSDGFIYRTKVRGFTGTLPPEVDAPTPPADPSGPTPTPAPLGETGIVYKGIPFRDPTELPVTVLEKDHFVVGYCEDLQNPAWVYYRVGAAADFRTFPSPKFRTDQATASRVRHADYDNSGFDRGHMAPKMAMGSRFGPEGAKDTFVMSNVCPQFHDFNDGQWGDLEELIAGRKGNVPDAAHFHPGWADELNTVWVVVGPLFETDMAPLDSGVPVPSSFYCIIIDEQDNALPRALAFVMPHVDQRVDGLDQFLTSIDNIEGRTGLDFFRDLPNAVEDPMEAAVAAELWP